MNKLFCLLIFIGLLGCQDLTDNNDAKGIESILPVSKKDAGQRNIDAQANTTLESKITDTLMKLDFVKRSNSKIDSFTNHQHGIAFIFDSTEKNKTDISVRAGYNSEERFETYYHFYINPKTMEIRVYDIPKDLKLPLKEFIKLNL